MKFFRFQPATYSVITLELECHLLHGAPVQYVPMHIIGTGEQDVKLWNKGVTIRDLTKNLYCSYFLTSLNLFYYYQRLQYDHKTEQKSG